eukprot:CAMPEP_0172791226 /NCGR_PEP_ID=MMETSP1074-20121228/208364_1 /TAXON_ID=2916 /ORGANISM="Ceratium fusus, Strain PA161109" /LENGTH=247 /DNA_ID=CAMNT_0013628283 /DNA_START=50 /DNA_END=793 /DNA_ORIENTATION=-
MATAMQLDDGKLENRSWWASSFPAVSQLLGNAAHNKEGMGGGQDFIKIVSDLGDFTSWLQGSALTCRMGNCSEAHRNPPRGRYCCIAGRRDVEPGYSDLNALLGEPPEEIDVWDVGSPEVEPFDPFKGGPVDLRENGYCVIPTEIDVWDVGHDPPQEEVEPFDPFKGGPVDLRENGYCVIPTVSCPHEKLTSLSSAETASTCSKSCGSGSSVGNSMEWTTTPSTALRTTLTPLEVYLYREDSNLMPI